MKIGLLSQAKCLDRVYCFDYGSVVLFFFFFVFVLLVFVVRILCVVVLVYVAYWFGFCIRMCRYVGEIKCMCSPL